MADSGCRSRRSDASCSNRAVDARALGACALVRGGTWRNRYLFRFFAAFRIQAVNGWVQRGLYRYFYRISHSAFLREEAADPREPICLVYIKCPEIRPFVLK